MSDIVIKRMEERSMGCSDIDSLCTKVQAAEKPAAIVRLGKPNSAQPRLLKVSFPTQFECSFLTRVDACRKSGKDSTKLSQVDKNMSLAGPSSQTLHLRETGISH